MKQTIALIGRSTKEQRCKVKLCRTCLKNRYGEDLDVMIAQKSSGRDKEHVNTENYIFKFVYWQFHLLCSLMVAFLQMSKVS